VTNHLFSLSLTLNCSADKWQACNELDFGYSNVSMLKRQPMMFVIQNLKAINVHSV
jgi:hypothetical protein